MKLLNTIFFVLVIMGMQNQVAAQSFAIDITASENSLEVMYGKAARLSAGRPQVENQQVTPKLSTTTEDSFTFGTEEASVRVVLKKSSKANVIGLYVSTRGGRPVKGEEYQGIFFSSIPGYKRGISFLRYKPWNSWTKPVAIANPGELAAWDSQCFYWQYEDGLYGLAIPLSDHGYRTTLGQANGAFGSKALSYLDGHSAEEVPCMALGFGQDLYQLFNDVYASAHEWMGKTENLVTHKQYPAPLEYIGWCTWNASSLGSQLSEDIIVNGVASFAKNDFPLGWVLVDDGWFDHRGSRLRSVKPDEKKFPHGFRPMIDRLKNDYHVKHVGVWHALDGYWNGIDPDSPLGKRYDKELFHWKQKERVDLDSSPEVTYYFIKPSSDSLKAFYAQWHAYLKNEGVSFLKVDNQLVVERMSVGNFPINDLAIAMHTAMNASAQKYFGGALINCMDMTSDAYFNFGSTAVARSVEDYFPYTPGETYNLQHGNAAAHVLQGVYNNLYFSQMAIPDLDMFQSHNPNAEFHAIARAINNGPIYITDNIGEQNFELLKQLVLKDGRVLRADKPLLPSSDCLFQVQDNMLFKAFSASHGIGLLGVWNCADTDQVSGLVSAKDVELAGETFAVYERFSHTLKIMKRKDVLPVTLKRLGYHLYFIAPLKHGMSPLGLLNKYNAPATLANFSISKKEMTVTVKDGGTFGAVLSRKPSKIFVNGQAVKDWNFDKGLLTFDIIAGQENYEILIKI